MLDYVIAFLIGCLYTRIYYARISLKTDWWNSTDWFKGKWWAWLHKYNCELCPKRWYCQRYKDEYSSIDI
jgi:hypothetical protein